MLDSISEEFKDILAVMVSGDSETCLQGKLLSARSAKDGKAVTESAEVLRALKEWGLLPHIVGMVFDTTAVNTGWIGGAAKIIEEACPNKDALLLFPCRHHEHELWIGAAWYAIFKKDKSPDNLQFKEFQAQWDKLDKAKFHGLPPDKNLGAKRNQVVVFLKAVLQREKQPRDDYRECIELTLIVLGETPPPGYIFKKPGI